MSRLLIISPIATVGLLLKVTCSLFLIWRHSCWLKNKYAFQAFSLLLPKQLLCVKTNLWHYIMLIGRNGPFCKVAGINSSELHQNSSRMRSKYRGYSKAYSFCIFDNYMAITFTHYCLPFPFCLTYITLIFWWYRTVTGIYLPEKLWTSLSTFSAADATI